MMETKSFQVYFDQTYAHITVDERMKPIDLECHRSRLDKYGNNLVNMTTQDLTFEYFDQTQYTYCPRWKGRYRILISGAKGQGHFQKLGCAGMLRFMLPLLLFICIFGENQC